MSSVLFMHVSLKATFSETPAVVRAIGHIDTTFIDHYVYVSPAPHYYPELRNAKRWD
jgi:hypothetical protein